MKNLLDNSNVEEVQGIVDDAECTFDVISGYHPAYGPVIQNAYCRALPSLFVNMGKGLYEDNPALANFCFETAEDINKVIKGVDDQLCLPIKLK